MTSLQAPTGAATPARATPGETATRPQATHEVLKKVSPLADYDVADDPELLAAAAREGADGAEAALHELGELAGARATQEHARLANEHPPVLRTHDAQGHRIDEVEFHPSWHVLLGTAVRHGLHAAPWADAAPGAHVARAAKFFVWSQAEAGHGCPVSMTYAAVPPLRHSPDLARRFTPLLTARDYDPGLRPPEGKAAEPDEAQATYLGKPAAVGCRIIMFKFGNIDFEFLEPGPEKSAWRDILEEKGPGFHHFAFRTRNMSKRRAFLEGHGHAMLQSGEFDGASGRYAYFDTRPELGALIELLEFNNDMEAQPAVAKAAP